MWQMTAIVYVAIGLGFALFSRSRGVIEEGIAISGIADGSYSALVVIGFKVAVYSASILLWPIITYRLIGTQNAQAATKLRDQHLQEAATMGIFDIFKGNNNEEKQEIAKDETIYTQFASATADLLGDTSGDLVRLSRFSPPNVGDQMPNGYGEFGLTPSNPIPLNFSTGSGQYLSSLGTESCRRVSFEFTDSVDSDVVPKEMRELLSFTKPIEVAVIYANGVEVATLYVLPCFTRDSSKAPRGFKIFPLSAEEVREIKSWGRLS